jgi:hypothetical protein
LYGYDPLQMYVDCYIPWIREGTIVRTGRFISPMDIEAQLSPDYSLYTYSLMNTYDPFTTFLPGLSDSFGIVNYTAYKTSDKSYLVLRSDCLDDPRGHRTGFPGAYFEHALGFIYHIAPWCMTRPEIRFDYTSGQKAYDNGTRRKQFTFNWDVIIRF